MTLHVDRYKGKMAVMINDETHPLMYRNFDLRKSAFIPYLKVKKYLETVKKEDLPRYREVGNPRHTDVKIVRGKFYLK